MNKPTVDDIRKLRELMGCGMLLCKKALTEKATVSEAIDYLRKIGSEPNINGLSDSRIDVLQKGELMATFKTREELDTSQYNNLNSKIRFVNESGHYSYVK